jgi:CBS-domain-containing membrane protein
MTLRLAHGISRRTTKDLTAADVMKSNPKSIGHRATARNTAKFFCANALDTAPVIDDAGRPIGVVSRTDLLEYWGCRRDQLWTLVNGESACNSTNAGIYHGVAEPTVLQIMTPVVFCVPVDTPIRKVVQKILALEVRYLFVKDEHGVLVGAISVFDLLRFVASPPVKNRNVRSRPMKPVVSTQALY